MCGVVNNKGGHMKLFKVSALVTILLIFCPWPTSYAFQCSGNACKDIRFSFEKGCYITQNIGTRRVKVTQGPASRTLGPGESFTLRGLGVGGCITTYPGSETANYETVAAPCAKGDLACGSK